MNFHEISHSCFEHGQKGIQTRKFLVYVVLTDFVVPCGVGFAIKHVEMFYICRRPSDLP